ncbi:hypothetical protein EV2_039374 [Malus domestica]
MRPSGLDLVLWKFFRGCWGLILKEEVLQGPLGLDLEGGFGGSSSRAVGGLILNEDLMKNEEKAFLILRDLLGSFGVSKLQGFGVR